MNKITYEELIKWAEHKIKEREISKSWIIESSILTLNQQEDAVRELILEKCECSRIPMNELEILKTEDLLVYKNKVAERLKMLNESLKFIFYHIKKLESSYYSYVNNIHDLVDKGRHGELSWSDFDKNSEFIYGIQSFEFEEISEKCNSAIELCNYI